MGGDVDLVAEGTSQAHVDDDRQSAVVVPVAAAVAAVGVVANTPVSERRCEAEGGGAAKASIGIEQR